MYRQKLFSMQARIFLVATSLLALSVVLSYLFAKLGFIVFISIYGFVFLILVLIYELRKQLADKEPSLLVPLIVLSIPIQAVLVRTIPIQLAVQLSIALVILFYLQIFSSQDRYEYLQKIKPLLFPTIAFAVSIVLSYFIAGNLQRNDWVFLLSLLGSICYAYLAFIYCKDLHNIKKMLWALIILGVVQLPFLYAQSRGWTDWFPAEFRMFTSAPWGGTASSVSVLRYGGMFGDYELLAEYLDIAGLFCVGVFLFTSSRKERVLGFLSMVPIITAGFYTGSRTFILGLGLGVIVMIFLMITRVGLSKNLVNFLIIASMIVLAITYLSTQEIFSGYIARFQNTQISNNNFNTRDVVWTISFSLMDKMPFIGYGARMRDIFISTAGGLYDSPHSLYFWMFLTAGYPGLIAIILLVLTPVFWILRILFNKYSKIYISWAIVFIGIWVFWLANEFIIEFTRYPFYMNIVFLLLGIMASFYDLALKKSININVQSI
jgi:O-antigen ligase